MTNKNDGQSVPPLNRNTAKAGKSCGQLLSEESGQDLIEYALIVCFVALGAVASMQSLVNAILAVVTSLGTTLTTAT
jgi:pilus assembly protein Flp/PilA